MRRIFLLDDLKRAYHKGWEDGFDSAYSGDSEGLASMTETLESWEADGLKEFLESLKEK